MNTTGFLIYQGVLDHMAQRAPLKALQTVPYKRTEYVVRAYRSDTSLSEASHLVREDAWKVAVFFVGMRYDVIVKDDEGKVVFKSKEN